MSTFCSAFWKHTNIRPGGRVYPCCRFKHSIGTTDGDLDKVLHSDAYNELRTLSSAGEHINGCEKCYYEESIQHKSLRQEFNEKYKADTVGLEYLEIGIDNLCNLTCDGCNSEFSTSWRAKELRETGKANYDYMTIDTIKSVPDTVTKVLFLGGEPLSTKRHLELLKLVKDPKKVDVVYNTNAMYMPDIENETIWAKFKSVMFIVSIDGVGKVAETVRNGTKWISVKRFVEYIVNKNYKLEFNTVIHLNNYKDIENITTYVRNFNADWYINVLTYPQLLDIKNLPSKEKEFIKETSNKLDLPTKDFIINHLNTN
jgi:radical SAM protein with 4Fe4S-binding SPASM domain